MTWKYFKNRTLYYTQFTPITRNTIVCSIVAFLSYKALYPHKMNGREEESANVFMPFILLMGKITFWLLLSLIGLSILNTLATWIYCLIVKKNNILLHVNFDTETKKQRLYLQSIVEKVRRPILGFVKGSIFYDDSQLTEKFTLLGNKRTLGAFWRNAISGNSLITLPDIKEYTIKGGFLYFEDMLQLVSFAVWQPLNGHFYQPPTLQKSGEIEAMPKTTDEPEIRIEQLKPAEGELLNYKSFETGDDMRRIVWSVYAKSRELVVRTPERWLPYASTLHFYASFHSTGTRYTLDNAYIKEMLNHYKNTIWSIYDVLAKKEYDINYIPDQKITIPENTDNGAKTALTISCENWQTDTPISTYFNSRKGAILCITSLNDVQDIASMLDNCDAGTTVYFIKLSRTFRHFVPFTWIQRLLFLPPQDRLSRLRSKWIFSPLSFQVRKKEKEIELLLKSCNATTAIL